MQNDMLEWIVEKALERNCTNEEIVARLLLVNFGTIHSTANVSDSDHNECWSL